MRWIVYVLLAVTAVVLFTNRISSHGKGSLAGIVSRGFHQDQVKMGVAETEAERRELDEQMFNKKPKEPRRSLFASEKEDLTIRASLWEPRLQALNRAVDSDVLDLFGRLKGDIALLDEMVRTKSIPEIALEQAEKTRVLWGKIKTIYGVGESGMEEASSRIPSVAVPVCLSDRNVLDVKRSEADDRLSAGHIDECRQKAMRELLTLDEKMRVLGEKIGDDRLKERGNVADHLEKHQELVERVARAVEKGYQVRSTKDIADKIERLREQQERNKDQMQEMQRRNIIDTSSRDKLQAMQERMERMREKAFKE